jgi:hypothetical protein
VAGTAFQVDLLSEVGKLQALLLLT